MAAPKKPYQKWKRREKKEQDAISASIYPHYHCLICDGIIEKGQSYKRILRKTDRSISFQDFCSKKCYEEFTGPPGKAKKKSWLWIFYILIAAAVGVVIALVLIFGNV
ncbi:MAG: hypothetical protein ACTSRG_15820 [Candidatus Helarchaeota archaeon]